MSFKPINSWTKQSIVEHIKKNFKGKSIGPDGVNCIYRRFDKECVRKCAIGLFIPDESYTLDMEGKRASQVIRDYRLESYMPLNKDGMCKLQYAHDQSHASSTLDDMIEWIERNVA